VSYNECLAVNIYISSWVLPRAELTYLIKESLGAAPDHIYARGIPENRCPESIIFDKKSCTLFIREVVILEGRRMP
jgi:hypothetical protein